MTYIVAGFVQSTAGSHFWSGVAFMVMRAADQSRENLMF